MNYYKNFGTMCLLMGLSYCGNVPAPVTPKDGDLTKVQSTEEDLLKKVKSAGAIIVEFGLIEKDGEGLNSKNIPKLQQIVCLPRNAKKSTGSKNVKLDLSAFGLNYFNYSKGINVQLAEMSLTYELKNSKTKIVDLEDRTVVLSSFELNSLLSFINKDIDSEIKLVDRLDMEDVDFTWKEGSLHRFRGATIYYGEETNPSEAYFLITGEYSIANVKNNQLKFLANLECQKEDAEVILLKDKEIVQSYQYY